MILTEQYSLDIFHVDRNILRRLVSEAMKDGADYADLYFENTSYSHLVLRDGAVTTGGSHIDYGVGIRALAADSTGYCYSESTELKDMLRAAREAALIGRGTIAEPVENPTRAASKGKPNPDTRSISSSLLPFIISVSCCQVSFSAGHDTLGRKRDQRFPGLYERAGFGYPAKGRKDRESYPEPYLDSFRHPDVQFPRRA